jgi:hypothetical protein
MAAGYRWHVGQLTTGRIWRTFDVSAGSWSNSFAYGNAGKLEFSFPIKALTSDGQRVLWPSVRADTAPPKAFAAVSYVNNSGEETFLEAGPIWTRKFDEASGILSVGGSDLSTYMAHRKVFDWVAWSLGAVTDYALWTVTFEAAQRGLIAKRLVELIQYPEFNGIPEDEGPNAWQSLPIVLPDDADLGGETPAYYSESYYGYELEWVGKALQDQTEAEYGPEIQFVPRRRGDDSRYIEWVMRIGVEENGSMLTQAGQDWVFDYTVPKSPVRNISISEDGNNWAWTVWGAGQGEAEARPVYASSSEEAGDLVLAVGYPFLENELTGIDSAPDVAAVAAQVQPRVAEAAAPREQWTLVVSRDDAPDVGRYRVGDMAVVKVGDHAYLPAGDYQMRILGVSGSAASTDVTLTLQERPSEV